jgi:nitroimidazol reductase NimA-like FMN-containing flavoprotein (pyridoxamine 5'-phosphate oxidase superfamily)
MDESRLTTERNIWLATVRPGGKPHLVPIWFVWHDGAVHICTQGDSVKVKNLRANPWVSFALEDGDKPVLGEGDATFVEAFSPEVLALFKQKYNWDIPTDADYSAMISITPAKWLKW